MGLISNWLEKGAINTTLARVLPHELALLAAYDHAIRRVGVPGTADQLAQFRNEHAENLEELLVGNAALARRVAPVLRSQITAPHPGSGGDIATDHTEEALNEVLLAERRTGVAWGRIRNKLPAAARGIVQRFIADQERHLRFLEKMIEARVWEQFDALETP